VAALASAIVLRPATDADRPFLERVYASTRTEELAPVPWSDDEKAAFLAQQFEAQRTAYSGAYPRASFDVVMVHGEPAGRLYVDRRPADIRIVDIALLPEYRGRGIGTALLRAVQAEAVASNRTVSIHVERFNPARALYERLGFEVVGATGEVYLLLEWSGEDGLVAHDAGVSGVGAERHDEQLEGADIGVVERPDALFESRLHRSVEDQGEGLASAGLRGIAQPGHLGQPEFELGAVVGAEFEHVADASGEGGVGEGFEHRLPAQTLPVGAAQGSRNG
jgi:ribosomal protein S18 acetylase RimI-like enzyme